MSLISIIINSNKIKFYVSYPPIAKQPKLTAIFLNHLK